MAYRFRTGKRLICFGIYLGFFLVLYWILNLVLLCFWEVLEAIANLKEFNNNIKFEGICSSLLVFGLKIEYFKSLLRGIEREFGILCFRRIGSLEFGGIAGFGCRLRRLFRIFL